MDQVNELWKNGDNITLKFNFPKIVRVHNNRGTLYFYYYKR
jgi:hypothetical protein